MQEKIDAEIGNRIDGHVVLTIYLHEGGVTRCDCSVNQSLRVTEKKEATMK